MRDLNCPGIAPGAVDVLLDTLETTRLTRIADVGANPLSPPPYQALLERGVPAHIHVVVVIASTEGLEFAMQHLPENVTFWVGAVDREMTPRKYIVPGLGDAGDLAYGAKV